MVMSTMTDGSIKISASHGQKLLAILTAEREEIVASLGQKEAEILELMMQLNGDSESRDDKTLLGEIAAESSGGRRPKGEVRKLIIDYLSKNGSCRLTDVSKGTKSEMSTVMRNLGRLQNEGLVNKEGDFWTLVDGAELL
jgi:hypothetical protein